MCVRRVYYQMKWPIKVSFQVEYSPRYLTGFGLTDDEGIERFWSYLGDFTKLTRGITISNRQMALLTAAKSYGAEKTECIYKFH